MVNHGSNVPKWMDSGCNYVILAFRFFFSRTVSYLCGKRCEFLLACLGFEPGQAFPSQEG